MPKQTTLVVAAIAVLAIVAAGCGSSKKSSTSASAGSGATTKASGVKVDLAKVSFGKVLVGPNGHTVYLFEKDKGTTSKCTGKCATVWTPLTTSGQPQAGTGLSAARLSTSKRSDGATQVTYGGHPLYYYEDDKRPGQTEGEGSKEFGAEWYAVGANGNKVEKPGS
jgi:predicted lipoprotein with Yx(FWY)xxD motif